MTLRITDLNTNKVMEIDSEKDMGRIELDFYESDKNILSVEFPHIGGLFNVIKNRGVKETVS